MQLINRFKLELVPQFDAGKHVLELCGDRTLYEGNISECTQFGRPPELDGVNKTLDEMSATVPVLAPHTAPNAAEWDRTTLDQWVRANVKDRGAQEFIKWFSRVCLAAEPSESSLLYYLWWLRSGGGYENLVNIHGGAQEYWLAEGVQPIAERMAEVVLKASSRSGLPNRIMYNSPVRAITTTAGAGVCVTTAAGVNIHGMYTICALSPALSNRIQFTPPMPALRDQLGQRMPMGCVIKFLICYNKPWWRESGLSGEMISDRGPLAIAYDKSIPSRNFWGIVALTAGALARNLAELTPQARKAAVLQHLSEIYDNKAALTPCDYAERDWASEEWSRGCYMGIAGAGALLECAKALSKPVGRIHWAGTETAENWIGYIDGALESGIRAAREVIARLHPQSKL
eukprot:TRINITY_DN283_c0_g1_i4.p1 TRINITY_DN283_c0_g1~~TRINITY_DN283_c0_g1_i4.p1  ORF type:complete len:401 (+),score=112.33 TRINITY_DN283_c0_g1_i4:1607-2809(+)